MTILLTRFIGLMVAILCLSPLVVEARNTINGTNETQQQSASLRFAVRDANGFPKDESQESFDCTDKIYAITDVSGFKSGSHVVEFRWIDPNGRTRERTEYDFQTGHQPTVTLWSWLELSRAQGAAMIQWLNPAAGLEEFIGHWTLELLINGEALNRQEFEVLC